MMVFQVDAYEIIQLPIFYYLTLMGFQHLIRRQTVPMIPVLVIIGGTYLLLVGSRSFSVSLMMKFTSSSWGWVLRWLG